MTRSARWCSPEDRLKHTRKALHDTPGADTALLAESQRLHDELNRILLQLRGDTTRDRRNVLVPPSLLERVSRIVDSQWDSTAAPTTTARTVHRWPGEAFATELARLKGLFAALERLEGKLEAAGSRWTPGRLPESQMK